MRTDASNGGIGAILIQESKPVVYFSRKISEAETTYITAKKKCLAIVKAIQYFEPYMQGKTFTMVTDHSALASIDKSNPKRSSMFERSLDVHILYRA